jgi:DNA topoisomerase-1
VDPVSEKKIVVKDGRFGPYITDGVTNITVPRSTSIEELTREQAIELLAEKRAKSPAKKPARRKAAAAK